MREPAAPMVPVPHRVERVERESADTATLELRRADGASGERGVPGQFNMLYAFGVGESAISISAFLEDGTVAHTVRDAGATTHALAACAPGDVVGVRGPFGRGWPIEDAVGRHLLVVAGGIGIAPLRPVVRWAARQRDRLEGVTVLCGARTPDGLLFRDELARLAAHAGIDAAFTVDAADESWRGAVGAVTALIPRARFDPERTVAMTCGPEIMMRFVAQDLERAGVPAGRIHLSAERNMRCAIGLCGHCQLGPRFVCKDGPVHAYDDLGPLMRTVER